MILSKQEKENIKIEAFKLRKKLNLKNSHQIITKDILMQYFSHKCKIIYIDIEADADVISYYHPIKKVCIMMVNKKRACSFQKRLNFSLAHELGHLILRHCDIYYKNPNMTDDEKELLEKQADEFAGQFLVNEYKLKEHKKASNNLLSDYFFVSEDVIKIRKEAIGIHSVKKQKISLIF